MTCPGSSPTVGAVATGTASKAAVDEPGESCRSGSGAHVDPTEQNAQEAIGHLAGGVMPSAGSGRGRSNDRHEEDGNKTRNEDGVHHVAAISLGDAVRLKQVSNACCRVKHTRMCQRRGGEGERGGLIGAAVWILLRALHVEKQAWNRIFAELR